MPESHRRKNDNKGYHIYLQLQSIVIEIFVEDKILIVASFNVYILPSRNGGQFNSRCQLLGESIERCACTHVLLVFFPETSTWQPWEQNIGLDRLTCDPAVFALLLACCKDIYRNCPFSCRLCYFTIVIFLNVILILFIDSVFVLWQNVIIWGYILHFPSNVLLVNLFWNNPSGWHCFLGTFIHFDKVCTGGLYLFMFLYCSRESL